MLNMRKITVILTALFLVCALTVLSSAQTAQATGSKKPVASSEVVRGKIISIDTVKNEIVVKENKTGTEKTIAVDPKVISTLKIEENVKVTLKSGTNVAEKIKEIVKSTSSAPKTSK